MLPNTMSGTRLPILSLNLPHGTCIRLGARLETDWNMPISDADAPSFTAYALKNGLTVPEPKELKIDLTWRGFRSSEFWDFP